MQVEQLLESVDVASSTTERVELSVGQTLTLEVGCRALVLLLEGDMERPVSATPCRVALDIASNELALTARNASQTLVAGDAFLSLGEVATPLTSPSGAVAIVVRLHFSGSLAAIRANVPRELAVTNFMRVEPAAASLALSMTPLDEMPFAKRAGDAVICRMMATTVTMAVLRAWGAQGCPIDYTGGDTHLGRAVAAIHEHPEHAWTVEALAQMSAMSRTVFAERFRDAMGASPRSYVSQVRMQAAKRLLAAGHSVTETSRRSGYDSDEGFSRAFRRATGTTPSTWRERATA